MAFKEKSTTDKYEDCITLEVLLKICRGPRNRAIFPFDTIRLDERHLEVLEESGFSTEVKGIQRYSIENFFNWKLIGKPQLDNPIFCLPEKHEWMDLYYKDKLEKSLKCDTIIAVGIKNN